MCATERLESQFIALNRDLRGHVQVPFSGLKITYIFFMCRPLVGKPVNYLIPDYDMYMF